METDLPVVVVGKGISGSGVTVPDSMEFDVCACSESVRIVEHARWLAVNDVPAFDAIPKREWDKVDTVILPTYLHVDPKPSEFRHWREVAKEVSSKRIELYQLHTAPEEQPNIVHFGRCRSVSDSAIAFLLWKGYRHIVTLGIEWEGVAEYNPIFDRRIAKSVRHRRDIWRWTSDRIKQAGARVETWQQFNRA